MDIENAVFKYLKYMFISILVLKHFDLDYEIFVECNSSGYAIGGALMQYNKKDVL
jgi:hypothetical protein